jgi:hypothetical protein
MHLVQVSFFLWSTPPISCLSCADCHYLFRLINHNNRIKTSVCIITLFWLQSGTIGVPNLKNSSQSHIEPCFKADIHDARLNLGKYQFSNTALLGLFSNTTQSQIELVHEDLSLYSTSDPIPLPQHKKWEICCNWWHSMKTKIFWVESEKSRVRIITLHSMPSMSTLSTSWLVFTRSRMSCIGHQVLFTLLKN